jgi:capsular polysaccharide biosynthesis protein
MAITVLGAPENFVAAAGVSRMRSGEPGVETVARALVPPIKRDRFPCFEGQEILVDGWRAGVYDRDRRVCAASLHDRAWTRVTIAYDPEDIRPEETTVEIDEAVFGGIIFSHYGHFLLESTNRLWWVAQTGFKGPVLFQSNISGLPDVAARFFELLGLADQVRIVTEQVAVKTLVVPHRSLIIQKQIHPHFQTPLRAAADKSAFCKDEIDGLLGGRRGVYLTRTQMSRRLTPGEETLERIFAKNGYAVVAPEKLTLAQQFRLMVACERLSGVVGSALHTAAVARDPKSIIGIVRDDAVNLNFFMIDEIMGNESTYIYNRDFGAPATPRGYADDVALDLEKIGRHLAESGLAL